MGQRRLAFACALATWTLGSISGCAAARTSPAAPIRGQTAFGRAVATYAGEIGRMRARATVDPLDVDGALQKLAGALDELPYADHYDSVSESVDVFRKRVEAYELFAPGADDRSRLEATQQMLELVAIACVRLGAEPYRAAPEVRRGCAALYDGVRKLDPNRPMADQQADVVAVFEQGARVLEAMEAAIRRGVVRPPVEGEALIAR